MRCVSRKWRVATHRAEKILLMHVSMKVFLFAPGLLLAEPTLADTIAEDYIACLVGRAVVALSAQEGQKDADAAMLEAASKCPQPKGSDPDIEYGEMVADLVEEIAKIEGL
ncbi:hypothetical protein [Mesorhizobium sp. KR9-304]|uniref:hypothetical protein n=1 Tax=Mesorhizobium sp. KR9-304 TaxID=3156614 RepID=UPI0032B4572B